MNLEQIKNIKGDTEHFYTFLGLFIKIRDVLKKFRTLHMQIETIHKLFKET